MFNKKLIMEVIEREIAKEFDDIRLDLAERGTDDGPLEAEFYLDLGELSSTTIDITLSMLFAVLQGGDPVANFEASDLEGRTSNYDINLMSFDKGENSYEYNLFVEVEAA